MALNYCESCNLLEGETKEDNEGHLECAECGDLIQHIREHDDHDMER